MNDRLSELKGGGNEQPIDATRDIELGHVNEKNIPRAFMKDVFEQVEAVKVRVLASFHEEILGLSE